MITKFNIFEYGRGRPGRFVPDIDIKSDNPIEGFDFLLKSKKFNI